MLGFLRRRRHERTGHELYCTAVAAARHEWFYRDLGVPDTLDGRFDMVGLHAWLLIRRLTALPPPGPQVAQALFDAMFADMDINLRELGVSDLTVGKRVRAMWEAFHGRAAAYDAALRAAPGDAALRAAPGDAALGAAPGDAALGAAPGDAALGDEAALAEALGRNVWRGAAPAGCAARLAAHVRRQAAALDAVPAAILLAGQAAFAAPEPLAA